MVLQETQTETMTKIRFIGMNNYKNISIIDKQNNILTIKACKEEGIRL